jgi:hypothetical protein
VQTTADIDGGADAAEGDDHLEEAAHEHASVGAGAEDPVPVVLHETIVGERGDRDEGDQVEDAATSAVFLMESIGTRLVAVIRMVVVMLVSLAGLMSYPGSLVGTRGWPGWTRVGPE